MHTARFTKDDLRSELKGALLQFIRQTSAVFDSAAPYRLLGWPAREPADNPIHDIECWDFDEVARREGQALDVEAFQIARTFDEFYDYGVSGIRRSDVDGMIGGTEYSFAYAFVFDLNHSRLVFELNGGQSFDCPRSLETAQLAQARALLDGGSRFFNESDDPLDLLTFREVALLANMEERSVRNAAAGKNATLRTTTEEGATYVSREDARDWLKDRKGFVPSRAHGPLVDLDLLSRPFQGEWELRDFVSERAEHLGLSLAEFCTRVGRDIPAEGNRNTSSTNVWVPETTESAIAVAKALGVDPQAFELRFRELKLAEAARELRRQIEQLRPKAER